MTVQNIVVVSECATLTSWLRGWVTRWVGLLWGIRYEWGAWVSKSVSVMVMMVDAEWCVAGCACTWWTRLSSHSLPITSSYY